MNQEDRLRAHTDEELLDIAHELEARAEQFDAKTRQIVNDELRRRKLPLLGFGTSRF
jgi:hypothetical protein